TAADAGARVNADANTARPTPRSAVSGFRKTPNAKTLTAPPPTMRPQTVANTIHQRFAKMPRIGRSSLCTWPSRPGALLASLCGRRVAGKALSRTAGEGGEPARVSRVRVFRAAYTLTRPRLRLGHPLPRRGGGALSRYRYPASAATIALTSGFMK